MKLTKDLFGVRRGNVHPETIAAGEECPPELEDAARELGCLDPAPVEAFDHDGDGKPGGSVKGPASTRARGAAKKHRRK
jgi:hypothetical protein